MFCLVTLSLPLQPPVPGQVPLADGTEAVVSYGNTLFDGNWEHVSKTLRGCIAWCLAHEPDHRPLVEELTPIIEQELSRELTPYENVAVPSRWLSEIMYGANLTPIHFA